MTLLEDYSADHRALLAAAAQAAGFAEPVAFNAGPFHWPLLKNARKRAAIPLDGVLVHDWTPGNRKQYPGIKLGARIYEIEGVRFVSVQFAVDMHAEESGHSFFAVDRKHYLRLFRIGLRAERDEQERTLPPVLSEEHAKAFWDNTIGYLEGDKLARVQALGGRPRRGVLLTGEPGTGKTMACRWIWEECRKRSWEWRAVTPEAFRRARESCDPEAAVRRLFTVQKRGVIFFDDMDLALRDRDATPKTEDQSTFLTALDGIDIKEGVVYVFTTNCPLGRIDRAFKRPGRIDVVLQLRFPGAELRRKLIERWHPDIVAALPVERAVEQTKDMSFAEIEELKNLLIQRYIETEAWDWQWARRQFRANREEFRMTSRHRVGFGFAHASAGAEDSWSD